MTIRHTWFRSRLVAMSRNTFLGETHDTRTYETRFGLRVRVETICEMERIDSFERAFKIGETLTIKRPERFRNVQ